MSINSMNPEQATDIYDLLALGENDEIEFKSAKCGLPKDMWETYSAFANTHGGIIVLGVKEKHDHLELSRLTESEARKLEELFWRSVNNKETISQCLQKNNHVRIIEIDGSYVLTIRVPQATREQRPVYHKRVADEGTYRRNSSGDFKCSAMEVRRMMADADLARPADGRILKGFTWEDIDSNSFKQYRQLFANTKPDHPWNRLDDEEMMKKIGGYRKDRESGEEGFTLAGVLMFGKGEAITDLNCAPHFFPDYKEITYAEERWSDRIYPDGYWEANLFQFYHRVLQRLLSTLPTPFRLENGQRKDETLAHEALREAFANLCIHADYSEEGSLLVTKYPNKIIFSNPGVMLISQEQYFKGGESVCRNTSLQKMFMLMGAAEKAGSGVDKILRGWISSHWKSPYPEEKFRPNKVELVMPLELLLDPEVMDSLRQKLGDYCIQLDQHELILLATALTENSINHQRLSELLPLHRTDLTEKLRKLCRDGILIAEGHGRGRTYHLREDQATLHSNYTEANGMMQANDASSLETMQANDASSLETMQANNASSLETMQAIPGKLSERQMRLYICEYCREWRTIQQIADNVHRSKNHIRNYVLPKLLEAGILEKKFPQSQKHPNQQYKTKLQAVVPSSMATNEKEI